MHHVILSHQCLHADNKHINSFTALNASTWAAMVHPYSLSADLERMVCAKELALGQQRLAVMSLCSGMDVLLIVLATLLPVLQRQGIHLQVDYSAAEKNAQKRKAIMATAATYMEEVGSFHCHHVFGDIENLTENVAFDYKSNSNVSVPNADIIVCGFPCVDVSAYNGKRRQAGCDIATDDGQTSSCFRATLSIIRKKRPMCIILENVAGLGHRRRAAPQSPTPLEQVMHSCRS